eukprot:SAG11_NODE_1091_length_5910_cov_4.332817_1_plen_142_part_00
MVLAKQGEAELAELMASDGLAPARCVGLLTSLLTPCLAAPRAGRGCTTSAAKRSFGVAGGAQQRMQSQASDCGGGQEHATGSGTNGLGIAPRTLALDGVATGVRAACLWAVRRPPRGLPRLSGLGKLEEMRRNPVWHRYHR